MTTEEDPHLPVGAYVLHALPPAEEAAFENHLASCDACRQEVRALLATASRLGSSAPPVPVTPQARSRTLLAVARTRQDPTRQRTRPRGRRVIPLALAASVAAAVAFGGIAIWQHQESDEARMRASRVEREAGTTNSAIADVLTARDATVHTGELTDGTAAAVIVSRSQARAVFAARGLPVLTKGSVYELWYAAKAGGLRPAGLIPGSSDDHVRLLNGSPDGSVAVGITVEPAGGSKQPTTPPLGIISLTA
ncbi:anti-sigma factor [Streptomyces sp. NPDC000658]|uniref:anti-sigma factor n=1 Tax=Streptomyces sp. NPDC000658 TaxID=3154266 RepID=UPI00331947E5